MTDESNVRRNESAREELFMEFGGRPGPQDGDSGPLLSVVHRGAEWCPGFQFTGSGIVPGVEGALSIFRDADMSDWEIALWFTAPNGWLDDQRPVDLLASQPEAVVDAASRETSGFGG